MGAFAVTDEELPRYRKDGFLVVRALYDAAEVKSISEWTRELEEAAETRGATMKYFEANPGPSGRLLNRIENFVPYHEGFRRLATEGVLIELVSRLLGEDAVLFKDKINLKLPGGTGFDAHQDVQAGWTKYADVFVSVSVAIDAATVENGCLEVAAGHHQRGLIGKLFEPMRERELAGIAFQAVPQSPGDVVIFDGCTPHKSAPNHTSSPRRNLYLTYNRAACGDVRARYFADKRASFPPDIERDPTKRYTFRV